MGNPEYQRLVFIVVAVLVSIGLVYLFWTLVGRDFIQTLRSRYSQTSVAHGFGSVDGPVQLSEDQRPVRQVRDSHPPIRVPAGLGRARV